MSFAVPGASSEDVAEECTGQGGELHAEPVEEAEAMSRVCPGRVVEQSCGELDASDRLGAQELAACG